MQNRCVCCGMIIPEGRQTCLSCEAVKDTKPDLIKRSDIIDLVDMVIKEMKSANDANANSEIHSAIYGLVIAEFSILRAKIADIPSADEDI